MVLLNIVHEDFVEFVAQFLCSNHEYKLDARSNFVFRWNSLSLVLHFAVKSEDKFCSHSEISTMFSALQSKAASVLERAYGVSDLSITWEWPQQAEHGDIATPIAMQLARQLKVSPKLIAEQLAKGLLEDTSVERTEVAGPGYVNVWLRPSALLSELHATRRSCSPAPTREGEPPVIIEYSQPNIAKPLGIHHIMSTVIGQAIANIHAHLGAPTLRVNHIGDWGTQFGKLAVALEKWGSKPVKECSIDELLKLYVKFHEEAEKDPSLEDLGRDAFRRIEQGDERLRAFWQDVVDITMRAMQKLYERLHVHIEHAHGEAMYEDMMPPILKEGLKKKVFKQGEKGAIVVEFPEETKLPTAVVQKGDSSSIYMTRDFAQIRYRIDRWNPSAIYYVVDVAQSLHFQQLFATVRMLQWDLPHLEHLVIGRMRFTDRKMSTRKGNILKLEEVLDEGVKRASALIKERGDAIQTDDPKALAEMMGTGAVVYCMISQNRLSDLVFDWDRMLAFEGNSAPYLQYTYARARSVLRKAGNDVDPVLPQDAMHLEKSERSLVAMLIRFPAVLEEACTAHLPHILANYLHQLCQSFNTFYSSVPILQASGSERALRLSMTDLAASVLQCGAELLTLRVPDRM